ncbi:ABC-type multidrug transport system ATPase subunit [Nocardiopsis mwathae]|uniref:ABC-type multidrug transport system ATPase subunit n=1 Tax=Nocardiopsis mwathae TaxID=1472723 RepID=A0A7W9YM61_9ACTN|nr:ABC-type multidrug transport system ATPase subunit [Nocardiopsis mwathae]
MRLVVEGLAHTYRRHRVLDRVDVEFGPGILGLLGPNGAGKTTLLRLLSGVLTPRVGRIRVGGHDLRTRSGRRALRRELGYLPQAAELPADMSPRAFLDYAGLLKAVADPAERRRQADDLIGRLGLDHDADRAMGALSAGTRRRVGVAQALMGDPRLVLLDEPTEGLDPEERIRLRVLLNGIGAGRTVVVSTHLLDDVQAVCSQVAVLDRGRTVYTGPAGDLTEIAADRVFELPSDAAEAGDPCGGVARRVIAENAPPGARPVPPTMEEGYAALMRDLRAGGR